MQNNLNSTPSANRTHIGFFGCRNSGKSSLINALTGQNVSIVSQRAGTTTDPVAKPMEIKGLGPCVLIDTAGFDDNEELLGAERVKKTAAASEKVELAVVLISAKQLETDSNLVLEQQWAQKLVKQGTKLIWVLTQIDAIPAAHVAQIEKQLAKLNIKAIQVSIYQPETVQNLRQALVKNAQPKEERTILGDLVQQGDLVVLVMPQDIQAPQGRLILPQVQTIRELLDRQCIVAATTTINLSKTLASLSKAPNLIITDSQAFKQVYDLKPKESRLTSFSILFAAYKGDLNYYLQGTDKLAKLNENAHVLIAECCSHAPLQEDIGRVKLPRLLRRSFGEKLHIDIVSGQDFPQDLTPYDLIIQCGACMFNRQHVLSRIAKAKEQHIPMSNYGLALAYLNGLPLQECALPQHNK